ncbi:glycosyltransferase [candidate division KSB3 bacterium]|uniref:Glycosyltransferase n=1 Tax=candidate division KSB3 bacterium TaxID=2044937 RepID=A0A9D5JTM5_9BACT|nr:glycosyltransferase [candidate division KSB3 bacterium]MBD3324002.1 glycosyltransferase [candidate division KSB3 bacterium]
MPLMKPNIRWNASLLKSQKLACTLRIRRCVGEKSGRRLSLMRPEISVLMSVYNGERYLSEAVESILRQTFSDFEYIIFDDGSTDRSWDILTKYAGQDQRIRLFRNATNLGLTKTLNKGLTLARGTYIARQDADDISLSERFAQQVAYMEAHPSVALVSTGVQYIHEHASQQWVDMPPHDPLMLRWLLLFWNPIKHSTVLWRRELVTSRVGHYNPSFVYAQDYDLWVRMAEHLSIATLPLVLVTMRWHDEAISVANITPQDAFGIQIIRHQLRRYFPHTYFTEQEVTQLRCIPQQKDGYHSTYLWQLTSSQLEQAGRLYFQLWKQFRKVEGVSKNDPQRWVLLHHKIEQDLVALLRYCKHRKWLRSGARLIRLYLQSSPQRAGSFGAMLLRRFWSSVPRSECV